MSKCNKQPNYEEDLDCIDFQNYKGIFYNDSSQKFQDEKTGAHFEYKDMCRRLTKLKKSLPEFRDSIKENKSSMTLNDFVNAAANQRNKSAITKDLLKLVPNVQETRNGGPRPAHLYNTTIGKTATKKSILQRNHSIGNKKLAKNTQDSENLPQSRNITEARKAT